MVRRNAAKVLGNVAAVGDETVIQELVESVKKEQDLSVQYAVIEALGSLGGKNDLVLQTLIETLKTSNKYTSFIFVRFFLMPFVHKVLM